MNALGAIIKGLIFMWLQLLSGSAGKIEYFHQICILTLQPNNFTSDLFKHIVSDVLVICLGEIFNLAPMFHKFIHRFPPGTSPM